MACLCRQFRVGRHGPQGPAPPAAADCPMRKCHHDRGGALSSVLLVRYKTSYSHDAVGRHALCKQRDQSALAAKAEEQQQPGLDEHSWQVRRLRPPVVSTKAATLETTCHAEGHGVRSLGSEPTAVPSEQPQRVRAQPTTLKACRQKSRRTR